MPTQTAAERVAAEVRAVLARQGRPQHHAAAILGMSRQSFSRRMTGEIPFDVVELHKLADALGVPVGTFLGAA